MRSFYRFIQKYHFFILFVVLEFIFIYIAINNNQDKKAKFLNSAGNVSGFFLEHFNIITEYFSLKDLNEALAIENVFLYNSSKRLSKSDFVYPDTIYDKKYIQQYVFYNARVINNSVNKTHNYLTLNKGTKHGIKPDMAVVSPEGIVGIVRDVSKNFCSVISILNTKLEVSAKLRKNNFFGSLIWEGTNFQFAQLGEIPNHVHIQPGDTVVTSGYSNIFPEGFLIGTIYSFSEHPGGNFYDITLKLSTNFKNLTHVYIVGNLLREEQLKLENSISQE